MLTRAVDALQLCHGEVSRVRDVLTVEAVLQIRVNGVPYTTTVRTPGHDELLVRGLLFSEGIVPDTAAPFTCCTVPDPETGLAGAVDVHVAPEFVVKDIASRRSAAATASCGLCGTRDAADLGLYGGPLRLDTGERLDPALIGPMFAAMRAGQAAFTDSGGSHAAAAFTIGGELLALHEDIGRHNAVDKVLGALLANGRLAEARCLTVSGRLSYEIVFKAFHAGLPFLLAVSAPSSLAVDMAERFGLCLIAFCRAPRATVYTNRAFCAGLGGKPTFLVTSSDLAPCDRSGDRDEEA